MRHAIALSLALAVTTACASSRPAVVVQRRPRPWWPRPHRRRLQPRRIRSPTRSRHPNAPSRPDGAPVENGPPERRPTGVRPGARHAAACCRAAPAPTPGSPRRSTRSSIASAPSSSPRSPRGDGFTETASEPASIDTLLSLPPRRSAADAGARGGHRRARRPRGHGARHPDSAQRPRAAVTSSCSRAGCATFLDRRPDARRRVPADDPDGVPRGRAAARPGLRAAGRKRLQADRAVARERPRRLAVHAADRHARTASNTTGTSTSAPTPRRRRGRRRST